MKKLLSFIVIALFCCSLMAQNVTTAESEITKQEQKNSQKSSKDKEKFKIVKISQEEFAKDYFNYKDTTAVFKGKVPVIVDCYADWCGPCKRLAPILEELNEEYAGKIRIVKINVDENRDMAQRLGVRNIPTMFFFVKNEKPARTMGLLPKEQIKEIIDKYLLNEKDH